MSYFEKIESHGDLEYLFKKKKKMIFDYIKPNNRVYRSLSVTRPAIIITIISMVSHSLNASSSNIVSLLRHST